MTADLLARIVAAWDSGGYHVPQSIDPLIDEARQALEQQPPADWARCGWRYDSGAVCGDSQRHHGPPFERTYNHPFQSQQPPATTHEGLAKLLHGRGQVRCLSTDDPYCFVCNDLAYAILSAAPDLSRDAEAARLTAALEAFMVAYHETGVHEHENDDTIDLCIPIAPLRPAFWAACTAVGHRWTVVDVEPFCDRCGFREGDDDDDAALQAPTTPAEDAGSPLVERIRQQQRDGGGEVTAVMVSRSDEAPTTPAEDA